MQKNDLPCLLNLSSGLWSCLEINFSLTEASGGIKDCLYFFVISCVEHRSLELEFVEFSSSHKVGRGGDEGQVSLVSVYMVRKLIQKRFMYQ